MSPIDILKIQPQVLNKTLSGKTILLAAAPKFGKTEFCVRGDKVLVLAFEKGTNAQPGALIQDIMTWSDFKLVLRQLKTPQAHELYKNVAIDTVQWAWDLCTKFICQRAGVQNIGDVGYGKLYSERDKEFKDALREIVMNGYGLILTSHMKEKAITEDLGDGKVKESLYYAPDLDARCLKIVNALVDIIGIGVQEWDENGQGHRYLLTRATQFITAGSRFRFLDAKIPFTYKDVEAAVERAIEKEAELGATVIDEQVNITNETKSFDDLMAEARELWGKLVEKDEANADKILRKVEIIFGKKMRLSEVVEGQEEPLTLIIAEMKEME